MKVTLANGTELEALKVEGGKRYVQNAQRDVLSFHFAKEEAGFDALDTAFGSAENTERIVISSGEEEALHEGYILRQSLASKPVLISPETATEAAVYEERYIVEMAQETYTEKLLRRLTAQ